MMTGLANVNYLAILASGVAAYVIGFVWYGFLFKKLWSEGQNFSPAKFAELQKSFAVSSGISFVGYLVTGYVLCLALCYMGITDLQNALWVTFLLWLGFSAMTGLMNALYEGKSLVVFLIDTVYQLIYMLATAAILTLWR